MHQKRCGFCLNVGCSLNIVDSSVAGQGKSQKTALNEESYIEMKKNISELYVYVCDKSTKLENDTQNEIS